MRKLGPNQERILQALRNGQQLIISHENGSLNYRLEGYGEVSKDSVQRLLERKLLEGASDGMFGVDMTLRLSEQQEAIA